jgi:hypothetical protein
MTKQEQHEWNSQQLRKGLIAAYTAMLAFKRYKQTPVIISRDGEILAVHPDDMPTVEELLKQQEGRSHA